jgi:hypothetical protein
MTSIPTSIRVGYRDYRVEMWSAITATSSERYAECDRVALVIRVREDLPEQFKAECVLHETLHAAYDMAGLESGDPEERTVSLLSNQLAAIWRDNPDLVAYLSEALRP